MNPLPRGKDVFLGFRGGRGSGAKQWAYYPGAVSLSFPRDESRVSAHKEQYVVCWRIAGTRISGVKERYVGRNGVMMSVEHRMTKVDAAKWAMDMNAAYPGEIFNWIERYDTRADGKRSLIGYDKAGEKERLAKERAELVRGRSKKPIFGSLGRQRIRCSPNG